MPLIKSSSKDAVSKNIGQLVQDKYPQKQAVAIALDIAKRSRAAGGRAPEIYKLGPRPMRMPAPQLPRVHTGAISGPTLGRADARPMQVPAGAYVIPSAVVSHLGQGNTMGGNRVLDAMFKSGPYGTAPAKIPHGRGVGIPRAPAVRMGKFADGGMPEPQDHEPVPIFAADGEYVLSPEQVAALGDGDMDRGHAVLDEFVKLQLANAAKTIRNLPGPRKR